MPGYPRPLSHCPLRGRLIPNGTFYLFFFHYSYFEVFSSFSLFLICRVFIFIISYFGFFFTNKNAESSSHEKEIQIVFARVGENIIQCNVTTHVSITVFFLSFFLFLSRFSLFSTFLQKRNRKSKTNRKSKVGDARNYKKI